MIITNKKSDLRIEYIDIYVPNDHEDQDPEETKKQNDIFLDKLKLYLRNYLKKSHYIVK